MRIILFSILILGIVSCKPVQNKQEEAVNQSDNPELLSIYDLDQSERQGDSIDWERLSIKDSLRQIRVQQLLDSNQVLTSKDYYHAAMIFQHGYDTIASAMAVALMRKSIELDSSADKWLLAAAIDRDLMRRNQAQIYGTQYIKMGKDAPWERYKLDSTIITDAERKEYNVESLSEQRMKLKEMNAK